MLTIGTLSRRPGTKVQTIRYYEQIGLMNETGRTAGGQRRYFDDNLDRLAFIRQLGFLLESIRELLVLSDNSAQPCVDADSITRRLLRLVKQRTKRLNALKKELKRMIAECICNSGAQGFGGVA